MTKKINIEKLEEYLKKSGLGNGELEALLEPVKQLNNQRRYGLVWEEPDNTTYGTDSAEQELLRNFPFLKEVNEHRIFNGEQHPDHLLIEGDNLHALKTMQYTHKNKIDVIYIDPPYNTGNTDFVYNDKYVDNEDSWRHSKWLSFMNKRLRLARELMTDEGVIFISIDDNELYQLKLLCDHIFGESNFIANMVWANREGGGGSDNRQINTKHEYVLIYSKTKEVGEFKGLPVSDVDRYKLSDEYEESRGKHQLIKLESGSLGYVKTLDYSIDAPDGTQVYPNKDKKKVKRWRWSKKKLDWGLENGYVVIKKDRDNDWAVYTKQYLKADNAGNIIDRTRKAMGIIDEFSTTQSNKEIKDIFGYKVFDYTKPTGIIKYLLDRVDKPNATILDFFAGSGTTAHAVMELNKEDGGNRQAIVITNNEINSSEEERLLVEKGYIEAPSSSRRGTKKHSEWLEKVNEFKQTPEYLEFIETDEYKDLGIARSVTEQRINKVINGYTTPKGKEVEGLSNNNFYHFEVVLEPDLLDMDLNTYVLVNKTKDIIRIKEGVYTTQEDIGTETTPAVKLVNDEKEVIVVLSVRVTSETIEQLVNNFADSGKQHIIYTSYTGYDYGINNIIFKELPKELLQAIKHSEDK